MIILGYACMGTTGIGHNFVMFRPHYFHWALDTICRKPTPLAITLPFFSVFPHQIIELRPREVKSA
jgi:hypothetical protein